MDDEDGRCLLDVICDPEALNDFLHGSETHLDTDDLLDGSADPSSSFFSSAGGHVPEVQPPSQLSASVPVEVPSGRLDLDFLEDDDILAGTPTGGANSGGIGTNHEPCDILQQSLAEANITEQSLQEAEAELDLGPFGLPGLTQVVQTLPDPTLSGAGGTVGVGLGVGGTAQIFPGPSAASTATPPNTAQDMIGPVLAHPGLQLQPQGMNKAISVQPFMQQVGLGNVTLQPISGLQALPNGSQSGHLGIGQIQVMGQPTVMAINQSGQPILAKTIGGYQLQQPGPETGAACTQAGLGGSVLSSAGGGGLLIQGSKTTLGSPALNGASVSMSSASTSNSGGGSTMSSSGGLVSFGSTPLGTGTGIAAQQKTLAQGPIVSSVPRTPTPIQPKPPQGGVVQTKLYKAQQQQSQLPTPHSLQSDGGKGLAVQQGQVPVSAAQNVAFLAGKPSTNVVLSTQPMPQGTPFPQTLFKPQAPHSGGKPLSVHLSGSIVIPSQTVLQGQNQFLLPHLQAGGQILTQHPGGHIITSQGPGGQLIANQILTANQNLNLGQVLTSQGHSGTAHILSGHIQLQPGQMGHPTLFQMPVSLAQTQAQAQHGTGHPQTVIQGMPIQNSLAMLGQVEGLSPAVSLQPSPQQLVGGIPSSSGVAAASATQCQPGESITVLGSTADQAAHPVLPPSILTVQTAPSISVSVPSSTLSSSPSSTSSASSNTPGAAPAPPQVQHSPGKSYGLLTSQGSSMILSHESLQMFLQQEQQQHTETASPPLGSVPASVIVSSCAAPATSGHDGLSAEAWPGQGSGSASPLGPANKPALVYQIPSTGQQQQPKVLGASPSHPLASHTAPSSHVKTDSPQPTQPSPLILGPQIQSPHHPQQSRPPSRSCTPSSLPPLFIIHNQLSDSPQHASQTPPQTAQPQVQAQLQGPGCPPSQPAPFQTEAPPSSCSPNPPQQALPLPFQFAAPLANAPLGPGVKQQVSLQCLTAEQQQTLQLVGAQLQTLSTVAQPSPQQKHLIDRLHQVQHSIILKQQGQPPVSSQFSPQQDVPGAQIVTSAGASAPAQLASLLQPSSVLVKAPVTAPSELKVLSAAPVAAGAPVKQAVAPTGLPQPEQLKPGLISSVGGTGGLQIQVLASGLSQMTTPQAPAAVQSQTASTKMPFSMQPSKEARMLEQLRRQQGSALHPDYSSPFTSFGDAFHKLIPYHLYQGTPSSPEDNHRVDGEFESVSSQLLKRTQAMLDKYRLLLFEESKRLGPSAEMVMIDRMFIMEEKSALNQDRVLAKERPDEYIALQNAATAGQCPLPAESTTAKAALSVAGPTATPAPVPALVTPTKLVIKQGGSGASVSWSTSTVPAAITPSPSLSSIPASSHSDDDDALPQRSKKPPIKTYEARRRIGLKLKIKQEAGLSKVVHNTALDPVHAPARPQADPQPPRLTVPATGNRTALPTCTTDPSPAASAATSCTFRYAGASSTTPSPSLSSSSSSAQVNGTVEHHGAGGAQRNPVAPPAPVPTTCRLPLRKTYRENVSPPLRPTVPLSPSPHRQGPPSPLSRTVIASVKVENQSGRGHARPRANTGGGEHGTGGGGGIGSINVQREQGSPPGLMQELAEVEEVFNRGIIKNRHHLHRSTGEEREGGGKSRERSSRAGHPSPGPPSPAGSSGSWDSFFPAKRHKSDSPDMDNASFSSGSPPPDDSLNEHLQSAIDSILNLQQGPAPASSGSTGRGQAANSSHQPLLQCPPAPSAPSYRPMPSSGSPSVPQRSQPGGRSGEFSSSRGQNGKLVSRTYRR